MKATCFAAALAAVALTAAGSASAQSYTDGCALRSPAFYPSCSPSRASTYGESVYRSLGALIRARGQYNYYSSLAAINREEARSRQLENRQRSTEVYFEMREMNRQARANARGPRPTAEDLARYAKQQAPDRLAAHQMDTQRGVIHWPHVFDEPQFAAAKRAVDKLAHGETAGSASTGSRYAEAQQHIARMEAELKSKINVLPSSEYIAARKFLIGLDLEFRSPQVSAALAAW